jgi:hypothetical protein
MEPYTDQQYTELQSIQLLERLGVNKEAAMDIFSRSHPCRILGAKMVSLESLQRTLQADRNTEALNVHDMAAAMRVEDYEALDRTIFYPERGIEIER